ncbi:MAG: SAM-dependent DNA methyltransferase, partial [Alphaproteobacteria bacterium]|nr:SAM-dependent DNA methyltransferase [Alphaproteobacteria bacterium]
VLFGSSKAHKDIRRMLVEDHKLDAVIKLPSGTFRPYAGVSTAILVFTKTDVGGTENVWFYDIQADGYSLDDKRTALLISEKLGPTPSTALAEDEHAKNNLPDVLTRWEARSGSELENPRTAQSFCVTKENIAATGYALSPNRYKEVKHLEMEYPAPKEILVEIRAIEMKIGIGLSKLEEMLG